jgi:hypothetical protein
LRAKAVGAGNAPNQPAEALDQRGPRGFVAGGRGAHEPLGLERFDVGIDVVK